MKKFFPYLKNKFILASTIFFVYTLFLDENDIFTLISQTRKLNKLELKKDKVNSNLKETRKTLDQLKYLSEVERYAREKKYFKKDNEDVFVLFSEAL
ncbi:MAG: septum formation initiator family protein [Crocinitomicaceae bacterium]|nr:septum formation initiator family protein [Crocinitomicaceae bacterium]MDG1777504.1 septum formation initiator family protein [Crocinitomicaceae bacterium]